MGSLFHFVGIKAMVVAAGVAVAVGVALRPWYSRPDAGPE